MTTKTPLTITPSQTVGPFYAYCLTPEDYGTLPPLFGAQLATEDAEGERITIQGTITDGEGAMVPDALIEIWQPDGQGRFAGAHPELRNSAFKGFGRRHCDKSGNFSFQTVKPGRVPTADGVMQAPHIALSIFGKGLNRRLYTRIYFADEASNAEDPVLSMLSEDERVTLIATSESPAAYRLDIRLQGDGETVFFEA
ncbi:protocatechuate 3,4-dioxygenase subunit alpha [Novosphingobium resinovorum]|uniref:Sulfocatechol 3,4-dioxygenase alpha subunit n=1 Tax=Novosphingobium resinovorum TaxID=158500 RepID=Q2TPV5_9SPHN|nr:protocatechuate 3,4-dioxygenase subunit alpha [Novosphingobium resinovorum]AAW29746.1 sulfocatechol 3,4-dioxygenase alpha subunit [Novosphingobium resinovorum]AOR81203.1 sulfocatechol 3,4-dioxygenase subunit alpha [Novosphingobium resinovorum]